jgi:hypothetical protein
MKTGFVIYILKKLPNMLQPEPLLFMHKNIQLKSSRTASHGDQKQEYISTR